MGVTARPMPEPDEDERARRDRRAKVLVAEIWASQANPPPATSVPRTIRGRGPNLGTRRAVTCAPAAISSVWGRKASPACSGL